MFHFTGFHAFFNTKLVVSKVKLIIVLIMVQFCLPAFGQNEQDTTSNIIIENANNQVIDNKSNPPIKYFNGDVRAYHEGSFFFCDTAKLIGNALYAYGNVVIIQHDTIKIFCDELFYDGDSLFSYLKGKVILENKNDQLFTDYMEYDMEIKTAYYNDRAMLVSDKTTLKSRKGVYDINNDIAIFKERVSVEGEDFDLITDTLVYNTKTDVSTWTTPALIQTDSAQIYSEKGTYNTNSKYASLYGNAQYKKEDATATADTILYNGLTKDIELIGHAKYISKDEVATADQMIRNDSTEITVLIGNAKFDGKSNKAEGEKIVFDKKNDAFKFDGAGTISDSTNIISADFLDYSKKSKLGIARGNVIWRDTVAKTTIKADSIYQNGNSDYMTASNKIGKPVFITDVDGDSMHITADTLRSFRIIHQIDSITFDTIKYFTAFYNVKILKTDMQGLCDSLILNQKDSVFSLFRRPVLWTDTTQLSGDTIKIFLKNKTIDKLELISNGFVINSADLLLFNQIKGRKVTAFFREKQLRELKSVGNAQSLYYMLDDDKSYIGANKTECSSLSLHFKDKKVEAARFYNDAVATIHPMDVDHESLKLKGFEWRFLEKPKSVLDLNQ